MSFKFEVNGYSCDYYTIPIEKLHVDEVYQRHAYSELVSNIAENFSPALFGILIVSERQDSDYYIVDGQHRYLAAKMRGDIELLPCAVFKSENIAKEALKFVDCNSNRKKLSSPELFKAKIIAEDELAIQINTTLQKHGYVGYGLTKGASKSSEHGITCIDLVTKLVNWYGIGGLEFVLDILFPMTHGAYARKTLIILLWSIFVMYDINDISKFKTTLYKRTQSQWELEVKQYSIKYSDIFASFKCAHVKGKKGILESDKYRFLTSCFVKSLNKGKVKPIITINERYAND